MITILSEVKIRQIILKIVTDNHGYNYSFKMHRPALLDESSDPYYYIRLPLHLQFPDISFSAYTRYIILLIQSGNAAAGYFENDKILDHKVFSAYMVRKKQGKSQIKHQQRVEELFASASS